MLWQIIIFIIIFSIFILLQKYIILKKWIQNITLIQINVEIKMNDNEQKDNKQRYKI